MEIRIHAKAAAIWAEKADVEKVAEETVNGP
jgi:hypothetical protein